MYLDFCAFALVLRLLQPPHRVVSIEFDLHHRRFILLRRNDQQLDFLTDTASKNEVTLFIAIGDNGNERMPFWAQSRPDYALEFLDGCVLRQRLVLENG